MTPTCALAILLVPAHLWARGELRRSWKALAAGVAAAALVYAALNPYAVLQPAKVLAEMRHGRSFYRVGFRALTPVAFARYLPHALTWPGLVGAVAGIAWLVARRRADAKTLAPALAAYFVAVSIFTGRSFTPVIAVNARFGFFLYPFLALFMAGMLDQALSRDRRLGLLAAGLLAVLSLQTPQKKISAVYTHKNPNPIARPCDILPHDHIQPTRLHDQAEKLRPQLGQ